MKSIRKWITGITLLFLGVVVTAPMIRHWNAGRNSDGLGGRRSPETSALIGSDEHVGIQKLFAECKLRGGNGVSGEFVPAFVELLRSERSILSNRDQELLDRNEFSSQESLLQLDAVKSLGRKWAKHDGRTIPTELVVLGDINELSLAERGDLGRTSVVEIRQQCRSIARASIAAHDNNWSLTSASGPIEQLGTSIDVLSRNFQHDGEIPMPKLPLWFPILSRAECRFSRKTTDTMTSELRDCFPKEQFPSLYDENNAIAFERGIDSLTLVRMLEVIDRERIEFTNGVMNNPDSFQLSDELKLRADGKEEACRKLNNYYDAVSDFIRAYAEKGATEEDQLGVLLDVKAPRLPQVLAKLSSKLP